MGVPTGVTGEELEAASLGFFAADISADDMGRSPSSSQLAGAFQCASTWGVENN